MSWCRTSVASWRRRRLWMALAAGAVLVTCGGSSTPPSASLSVSPSGIPIRDVTVLTFTAAATDLTSPSYSWDFGDGTSGSGNVVTHVYASEGTFQVGLRVTGQGDQATASASVVVGSLNGTWVRDAVGGIWHELAVTQQGGTLTGRWTVHVNPGSPWYPGPDLGVSRMSGTVSDPRRITLSQGGECLRVFRNGSVNDALTVITGDEGSYGNRACGPTASHSSWSFNRR